MTDTDKKTLADLAKKLETIAREDKKMFSGHRAVLNGIANEIERLSKK